jgi:hypothetical protein
MKEKNNDGGAEKSLGRFDWGAPGGSHKYFFSFPEAFDGLLFRFIKGAD